jgi:hypothetical protein
VNSVVVVGSGASGVHFALTLLERGHDVVMLDVGHERMPAPAPDRDFAGVKETLPDPVEYLLGGQFEGVKFPGGEGEYYGIPPRTASEFGQAGGFESRSDGFAPLFSFARGGLAEAWTAGVYPFNRDELADFPFPYESLSSAYDEVSRRIGVTGAADDLARFMPAHDHMMEPILLDRSSRSLMDRYGRVRARLQDELGCFMGRSRVATLSAPLDGREPCTLLGRCLWGCPRHSLYTPSLTLAECLRHTRFRYMPGMYVTHFVPGPDGRVQSVVAVAADGSGPLEIAAGAVALAAGALSSARIFLESVRRSTGETDRRPGLMDNRQVLVPFVNLAMLGVPYDPASYQYHLLGIGLEQERAAEYVHCQITTLKTGMAHPVIQSLPCDLRTATALFRQLRSALGVINVNFHDTRRPDSFVTLDPAGRLVVRYVPPADESTVIVCVRVDADQRGVDRQHEGIFDRVARFAGRKIDGRRAQAREYGVQAGRCGRKPQADFDAQGFALAGRHQVQLQHEV